MKVYEDPFHQNCQEPMKPQVHEAVHEAVHQAVRQAVTIQSVRIGY